MAAKPKSRSTCTPEMVDLLCEGLSIGWPLATMCMAFTGRNARALETFRENNPELAAEMEAVKSFPGLRTVYCWMDYDEKVAEHIRMAREVGEDVIAADCLAIVDETPPTTATGGTDSGFVQHQKLRAWTRMQLLAKWNPKKYGEKVEQTIQGGDKPLQIDGVRFTVVDPKG